MLSRSGSSAQSLLRLSLLEKWMYAWNHFSSLIHSWRLSTGLFKITTQKQWNKIQIKQPPPILYSLKNTSLYRLLPLPACNTAHLHVCAHMHPTRVWFPCVFIQQEHRSHYQRHTALSPPPFLVYAVSRRLFYTLMAAMLALWSPDKSKLHLCNLSTHGHRIS